MTTGCRLLVTGFVNFETKPVIKSLHTVVTLDRNDAKQLDAGIVYTRGSRGLPIDDTSRACLATYAQQYAQTALFARW